MPTFSPPVSAPWSQSFRDKDRINFRSIQCCWQVNCGMSPASGGVWRVNATLHEATKFICLSANCLLYGVESAGNRCEDLCLKVFRGSHLCSLEGVDVFLNHFFKWSCAVCPDRWTEDKAKPSAWPSFKSSVCSPNGTRSGSCYMMCSSRHSFLLERRHWTCKEGARALTAKYWGLHTLPNGSIYSIKMWNSISYAPWWAYLEETQI